MWVGFCPHLSTKWKTKQKCLSSKRRVQRDDNNCHNNKMMRWKKKNLKENWTTFCLFFFCLFSHIAHWYFCSASFKSDRTSRGRDKGVWRDREYTHKKKFSWSKKVDNEPKTKLPSLVCVCRLLFACSWDIKWREIERKETHGLRRDSPICHAKQSNKKEVWKVIE
jgi:hypothetical protein